MQSGTAGLGPHSGLRWTCSLRRGIGRGHARGHVHSGVGLDVGMRVGMSAQALGGFGREHARCIPFGEWPGVTQGVLMNVDQIGCGTRTLGASQNILTDCVGEMDISGVVALRYCTASICMRMNSHIKQATYA